MEQLEGATRIVAPDHNAGLADRAPGARSAGQPFYNPGMALNRDLSVLLVEAEAKARGREIDVADALAGTGARSVRLAREVQAPLRVHANDAHPPAVASTRDAVRENGLESRVMVTEGDAHVFLAQRRFDVVDLDPCGSPMPFMDAAVRSVRHGGLLLATATDTGALAGAFPRVCRRRYDAHHGLHAQPWRAEVGLRILAGAMVRSAARFERAADVVLSVSWGHWMRVGVRIRDGKGRTDDALASLGTAVADERGHGVFAKPEAGQPHAGPLWMGGLHDPALLAAMRAARDGKTLARGGEVDKLLELLQGEAGAPAFFFDPDDLQKRFGNPPQRDELIRRLREAGRVAARCHLEPKGIRTDATLREIGAAWKLTAPPQSSLAHPDAGSTPAPRNA